MKFTIDTQKKTLTLLEQTSFKELEAIKKFLGEDWKDWQVSAEKVTVTKTEFVPSRSPYWKDQYFLQAGSQLSVKRSDDYKKYSVNAESIDALSTLTMKSLLSKQLQ